MLFFDYPRGYIREWHRELKHGSFLTQRDKWFFDYNDVDGSTAEALHTTVCEDLAIAGIIIPEMSENEYRAQVAVGYSQFRVYRFNDNLRSILKKDFVNYLDKAPIVWL